MSRLRLVLVLVAAMVVPWPCVAQGLSDFSRNEWDDLHIGARVTVGPVTGTVSAAVGTGSATAQGRFRPPAQQGQVPAERRPWSGDWWPRSEAGLAFRNTGDGLSPFEKYDTIVLNMYGRVPGATAWEADPAHGHNDAPMGGVNWAGHCNGWAAASILSPEPVRPVTIPLQRRQIAKFIYPSARQARRGLFRDGRFDYSIMQGPAQITLTIDDMKGWLAETHMMVRTQQVGPAGFLGTRYNQPSSSANHADPAFQDIHPQNFHYLLDTFIRDRGQPFVSEINPYSPVDNKPLYAFDSSMQHQGTTAHVTTRVSMADYANRRDFVGTNTITRTYAYVLRYDTAGRVVGGQWTGNSVRDHPDFVWIPVGNAPPQGTFQNPCINSDFVDWLLRQAGAFR